MEVNILTNNKLLANEILNYLKDISSFKIKIYEIDKWKNKKIDNILKSIDIFILDKEEKNIINKIFSYNIAVIGIDLSKSYKGICLEVKEEPIENISFLVYLLITNRRFRRAIINCQKKLMKINNEILFQIEGQFDSSYSLAIVNREIARALNKKFPGRVSLYPTDGLKDYMPNKKFLKENPDIEKMYKQSQKLMHAPTVLRYTYPPNVDNMKGTINGTTSYGWEESEFPKEYIREFNANLDFLPVMSPYVEKVMIDNGIEIPVFTIGLGADHILKVKEKKYPLKTQKKFKFLHISSCFPRKGIDILLDAYTHAFSEKDDVVLIIKTFPNPHNNVEKLIKFYQNKNNKAEIELINSDISEGEILYLYKIADCFILPSRGEGFGLPAAEAMLLKIPVITTGYGGQTFFCNEENAFLIDYFFENSQSHLRQPFSYWVTPKKEDLIEKMKFIYKNKNSNLIKTKVDKAFHTIKQNFKWENTVNKLLSSKEKLENIPVFMEDKINLLWISSFNTKCGIANYSEFIISNFSSDINTKIIANKVNTDEIIDNEKEKKYKVKRIWEIGKNINYEKIKQIITKDGINAIFIQHHFAFFDTKQFGLFIARLKKEFDIPIFITLHKTIIENKKQSLNIIKEELKNVERIFVHSINDLNIMKKEYNLIDNITLIPQGINIKAPDKELVNKIRRYYRLENNIVIGTFGFLRKHKKTLDLIKAFTLLKEKYKNLKLLLLTSLYPSIDSREYYQECIKYISSLPKEIKDDIIFITDYIPEEQIINYLDLLDILVYPYENVKESSSAAVRYGLAAKKIILTTPIAMFNDIEECLIKINGFSTKDIVNSLKFVLENRNSEVIKNKLEKINEYIEVLNWKNISQRLEKIIKYFTFIKKYTN